MFNFDAGVQPWLHSKILESFKPVSTHASLSSRAETLGVVKGTGAERSAGGSVGSLRWVPSNINQQDSCSADNIAKAPNTWDSLLVLIFKKKINLTLIN